MDDRLVLTLDGSTGVCGAALLMVGGSGSWEVVARRSEADGRAQARTLLRLVDEMLEEVGRRAEDLGAVVVGKGPGTFTGVRVTVATARALSLALAVPVAGVSTLSALAAGAIEARRETSSGSAGGVRASASGAVDVLVPVVDARRGQLFYGLYRPAEADGRPCGRLWSRFGDFAVCDRGALGEVAQGGLVAGGSVIVVGEEALRPGELPPGFIFVGADVAAQNLVIGQEWLDEPGRLPEGGRLTGWLRGTLGEGMGRARVAGEPAAPGFDGSGTCPVFDTADSPGAPGTPESVTPIYVRSPDADVHITRMRDPWADVAGGS